MNNKTLYNIYINENHLSEGRISTEIKSVTLPGIYIYTIYQSPQKQGKNYFTNKIQLGSLYGLDTRNID